MLLRTPPTSPSTDRPAAAAPPPEDGAVADPTRRDRRPLLVLALVLLLAATVAVLALDRATPAPSARVGAADGRIGRAEVTAYDTEVPAVARLDPSLLEALQNATSAADEDGLSLRINSGWRSERYQRQLLREAVSTYGTRAAARRWVQTPAGSSHVTGDAVDVGPPAAAAWLEDHGSTWGLCRTYGNERWHFELRTSPGGTCPALRPDAG